MIFIYLLSLVFLIEVIIFFSKKFGYYDKPDGVLKNHDNPTPKSGGIYFLLGITLLLILFKPYSLRNYFEDLSLVYVYIFALFNLIIGIIDDSIRFSPIKKMIFQSIVAITTLFALYIDSGAKINFIILFILFLGLIFKTNSLNIIDHYNGLSTLTYMYSTIAMNYFYPDKILIPNTWPTISLFVIFLFYNLRGKGKAKIFQGNGGSHFFGALLSIMFAKILLETSDWYNFFAVLSTGFVIFYPSLIDTLQVIISRIGLRLNPLKGSNHHISHRIDTYTSGNVYLTMTILFLLISLPSIIFLYIDYQYSRIQSISFMIIALLLTVFWFTYKNLTTIKK